MKCPDCGKKLHEIIPPGGEFVCDEYCPANINNYSLKEYYGTTQIEINKQKQIE